MRIPLGALAAMVSLWACDDPKLGTVARPLRACGHQLVEVAGLSDVSVLLVMDRSRSMASGGKWNETRAAVDVALAGYDRYLRFGLLMYPTEAVSCDVAAVPDVPIALGNGGLIARTMAASDNLRGTPTGSALRAAAAILADDPSPRRAVILATDGRPQCDSERCDEFDVECAAVEAYDATDALAEAGVPVYVVGIRGSDEAADILSRIADIGQTALSGDTAYYDTASGDDVARALVDIAVGIDGCTAALDPHDGPYHHLAVTVDGAFVGNDAGDGWTLVDDRLHLNGSACLASPGETRSVEVTWFCE